MEINDFDEAVGVVAQADTVEGRFVLMVSNAAGSYNFGSRTDLPGVRVPATAEEAKRAKYCLGFAADNRPTPILEPMPSMNFAVRGGWDQAANNNFSATVYTTHPANQEGLTVASGALCLACTVLISLFLVLW